MGGLVDLTPVADLPIAIVFMVQGGSEGGNALADVLSGKVSGNATQSNGNDSNSHLLSATLREYYNNSSKLANRFKRIATSVNASNASGALTAFVSVMSGVPGGVLRRKLAGSISSEVINKACEKLANFIF